MLMMSAMANTRSLLVLFVCLCGLTVTTAFLSSKSVNYVPVSTSDSVKIVSTALYAENDDLMRWARQSRSAGSEDNVVELMRPLGLVLNQDDKGNVYVETVAPKGNAARTGKVRGKRKCQCLNQDNMN